MSLDPNVVTFLWMLCALLISAFGNIVGIGGGVFMVPLLVIIARIPMENAIAVVAFSLFLSTFTATLINSFKGEVDFRSGLIFEFPAIFGAIAGALLTAIVPMETLQLIFAIYLIWLSFRLFRPPQNDVFSKLITTLSKIPPMMRTRDQLTISLPCLGVLGLLAGAMGGLLGIGGGIIKTPVMIRVFRFAPSVAVSTSIFMIAITSFFSALTHFQLGHLDVAWALPIGGGFFIGAIVGSLLKGKISSSNLTKLLAAAIGLAGIFLIIRR